MARYIFKCGAVIHGPDTVDQECPCPRIKWVQKFSWDCKACREREDVEYNAVGGSGYEGSREEEAGGEGVKEEGGGGMKVKEGDGGLKLMEGVTAEEGVKTEEGGVARITGDGGEGVTRESIKDKGVTRESIKDKRIKKGKKRDEGEDKDWWLKKDWKKRMRRERQSGEED